MFIVPVLAIGSAWLQVLAVIKGWRRVEFFAKPAVMIFLFAWLALETGLIGPAFWFAVGILFSLVGDVLLIWRDRFFLPGLFGFLCAHLAYLAGFNSLLPTVSMWSFFIAVVLGIGAARLLRRIVAGVHASGQSRLALPVMIYGLVITLMMLSALLTLSNTAWKAPASLAVALGAFLFYMSDTVLAWNKFVRPIKNGRAINISLYEAGQIILITGVLLQFG